jgi:hypothetical protein
MEGIGLLIGVLVVGLVIGVVLGVMLVPQDQFALGEKLCETKNKPTSDTIISTCMEQSGCTFPISYNDIVVKCR